MHTHAPLADYHKDAHATGEAAMTRDEAGKLPNHWCSSNPARPQSKAKNRILDQAMFLTTVERLHVELCTQTLLQRLPLDGQSRSPGLGCGEVVFRGIE
jgi:hypothetical protein